MYKVRRTSLQHNARTNALLSNLATFFLLMRLQNVFSFVVAVVNGVTVARAATVEVEKNHRPPKQLITLASPFDGSILHGRHQSISITLTDVVGGDDLAVCIASSKISRIDETVYDARRHVLFDHDSDSTRCMTVAVEGERLDQLNSSFDIVVEVDGWYALSVMLYVDLQLVSYSQSVVYIVTDTFRERQSNRSKVGLSFPIGGGFGWGTIGLQFALFLEQSFDYEAVFLSECYGGMLSSTERNLLDDAVRRSANILSESVGKAVINVDGSVMAQTGEGILPDRVIHALGMFSESNGIRTIDTMDRMFSGEPAFIGNLENIGIIFSETSAWTARDIKRLQYFSVVYAGSSWGRENILKAEREIFGISQLDVRVFRQGVNKNVFKLGSPTDGTPSFNAGKTVIYSGGKLELRKGQDIVLAAFRKLLEMRSDVYLLTAWQNDWPKTTESLTLSPHTNGVPGVNESGELLIADWKALNGVDKAHSHDVGKLTQAEMARLVQRADIAIFPSRCEGGTNLVAMEAISLGVPTIVSDGTGQSDVVEAVCSLGGCLSLPTVPVNFGGGEMSEWRETNVDDVVSAFERIISMSDDERVAMKNAGASLIWDWSANIKEVVDALK